MIPSRWSSAIAILRRRLYEAAAERRQLLAELRETERDRGDAVFDRRNGAPVEPGRSGQRGVAGEQPIEPPTAMRRSRDRDDPGAARR